MGRRDINNLLRVLIIEDNVDHVELLIDIIERHFGSIDIHTVETIEDAFDFIDQTTYNICFTDCYIKNESIIEEIPNLRQKLGDAPLIVITGSGDESQAAEVIKKGATDYLVKKRDSLEKIPQLINKYTKSRISSPKRPMSAIPTKERFLYEVQTLSKRARTIALPRDGKGPDIRQLETLLDQIERLKKLAGKIAK